MGPGDQYLFYDAYCNVDQWKGDVLYIIMGNTNLFVKRLAKLDLVSRLYFPRLIW